ncbi:MULTISPECIES: hypothetical protein [unclassified Breznakia]|uniref:hypothetical protein n=1 Tax=unclassified Breznakia TaxID=2623764 RepID=UPI002473E421|nr:MULTISPECIES: hypothetical protein [unclassified Breznakia]MDH6367330.1 hypothetical protein [Breznakia sp. PH1-1]MDH6404522.1 hypothetical protein [Breznakia sp. PF1-11]MDH6412231.1 hypothetical protein [Breznakia sp. PFB1-11]MDH6414497.1 hypothetical protein [Breznakia sp. PFB1-14]MDH6416895.1 hypothetical protein [Breznakia sp. PFB1-4]
MTGRFINNDILIVPLVYFLSLSGQVEFVWLAFPVAYTLSAFVSQFILKDVYKTSIIPISDVQSTTSTLQSSQQPWR